MAQLVPGGMQVLPDQLHAAAGELKALASKAADDASSCAKLNPSGDDWNAQQIYPDGAIQYAVSTLSRAAGQIHDALANAASALEQAASAYEQTEGATSRAFTPLHGPR